MTTEIEQRMRSLLIRSFGVVRANPQVPIDEIEDDTWANMLAVLDVGYREYIADRRAHDRAMWFAEERLRTEREKYEMRKGK